MAADVTPVRESAAPDVRVRRANVRTALVLASIAVVFFLGIVFAKYMGDGSTGMTVLGAGVLLFLVLALGRNLRK